MAITNLFPGFTLTKKMAFFMNEFNVKPIVRIISKPMVSLKLLIGCWLFAILAIIWLPKLSGFYSISTNMSGLFLEGISGSISGLFHSLLEFYFWPFAVFLLIFSSIGMIFRRSIPLYCALFSVFTGAIFGGGLIMSFSGFRLFHSLTSIVVSARSAISRTAVRSLLVFCKLSNGLWRTVTATFFVNTDFSLHDNHYIMNKGCALLP